MSLESSSKITNTRGNFEGHAPTYFEENPSMSGGDEEKRRLQRLGRVRPHHFDSIWLEGAFLFCIAMSQLLDEYLSSGFVALVPHLATELALSRSFVTWTVSVVPLIVSSFLLAFGRLADIYGAHKVYFGGLLWVLIWTFAAAFSRDRILLVCCRAMQGFGSAAHLSAGLAMLGTVYRPGPRKNVIFSVYGAMAPLGSFLGIATGALVTEYVRWQWYFWIGAILAACSLLGFCITTPRLQLEPHGGKPSMDWLGCITIGSGVLLSVFAVTELAHAPQGWRTPYIVTTGVLALLCLAIAFYVEGWISKHPLLPFSVLRIRSVRPLFLGLLFNYGTIGIYMLYATLYIRNVVGASPLQLVAWFAPMAIGGATLAVFGGFLMHLIPGNVVFLVSGLSSVAASLMFALAPPHASFWSCVLPAMIFATISIDLVFNRANIFLSTALPIHFQGLAGGLSNTLINLSIAVQLGFGEVVVAETSYQGEARSYRNAFWFAVACGTAALVIFALFVRVGKAGSEFTVEERKEARAADVTEMKPQVLPELFCSRYSIGSLDITDYKMDKC